MATVAPIYVSTLNNKLNCIHKENPMTLVCQNHTCSLFQCFWQDKVRHMSKYTKRQYLYFQLLLFLQSENNRNTLWISCDLGSSWVSRCHSTVKSSSCIPSVLEPYMSHVSSTVLSMSWGHFQCFRDFFSIPDVQGFGFLGNRHRRDGNLG